MRQCLYNHEQIYRPIKLMQEAGCGGEKAR